MSMKALISFRSLDVLRDAISLYFSSCALTGGVPLSDGLLDFILSSSLPVDTKLTPKQTMFVNEYLVDLNATQAAIRAGYSKKTARQIGHENRNAVCQRFHRVHTAEGRVMHVLA